VTREPAGRRPGRRSRGSRRPRPLHHRLAPPRTRHSPSSRWIPLRPGRPPASSRGARLAQSLLSGAAVEIALRVALGALPQDVAKKLPRSPECPLRCWTAGSSCAPTRPTTGRVSS